MRCKVTINFTVNYSFYVLVDDIEDHLWNCEIAVHKRSSHDENTSSNALEIVYMILLFAKTF